MTMFVLVLGTIFLLAVCGWLLWSILYLFHTLTRQYGRRQTPPPPTQLTLAPGAAATLVVKHKGHTYIVRVDPTYLMRIAQRMIDRVETEHCKGK